MPKRQPPRRIRTLQSNPPLHSYPQRGNSTDMLTLSHPHTCACTRAHSQPLNAGQGLSGGSGSGLHTSKGPLPHPRRCLPPAWDPDGAAFGLRAPTGSPEAPFPFSRGPALGSLPPRAHGLSTPTLPHPAVPISHAPSGPAAGGGFAGEGVSFCTLPGLQRGLTLKPLSVPTTLPPAQRRNP